MLGFLRDSDECNGLLTAHRLDASFLLNLLVEYGSLTIALQIPGPLVLYGGVVRWTGRLFVGRAVSALAPGASVFGLTKTRVSGTLGLDSTNSSLNIDFIHPVPL